MRKSLTDKQEKLKHAQSWIKDYRLARGMSQGQLSRKIGTTVSHVSKWENGWIKISKGYEIVIKIDAIISP